MDVTAQVDGAAINLHIPFDRELQDSEDAHQILVKMIRAAKNFAS